MTQTDNNDTLKALAAFLPPFVYTEPADGGPPLLAGPDGMSIHIHTANDHRKLHVFGSWPMRGPQFMTPLFWGAVPDAKDGDPSINVSLNRGLEAIARDISRRFLPKYRDLYAKCLQRQRDHSTYQDRSHANAANLAAIAGVPSPPNQGPAYRLRFDKSNSQDWYGDVHVSDTVTLELHHLPVDLAAQLLAVLYPPNAPTSDSRPRDEYECQNCASVWTLASLHVEIPDYRERVAPGEPSPAGECPECGALCHLAR